VSSFDTSLSFAVVSGDPPGLYGNLSQKVYQLMKRTARDNENKETGLHALFL
jgi:hypothetical protein